VALLLFDFKNRRGFVPAQAFILVAGLLALLAIIGHVYQVLLLNGLARRFRCPWIRPSRWCSSV